MDGIYTHRDLVVGISIGNIPLLVLYNWWRIRSGNTVVEYKEYRDIWICGYLHRALVYAYDFWYLDVMCTPLLNKYCSTNRTYGYSHPSISTLSNRTYTLWFYITNSQQVHTIIPTYPHTTQHTQQYKVLTLTNYTLISFISISITY